MPDVVTITSGSKTLSKGTSDFYMIVKSGCLIVSSGGLFLGSRPEISAYGVMRVSSSGMANPFVGSGGLLEVFSKGYVSDVKVSTGGTAFLYKSATCRQMTVSSGATVAVRGGNLFSADVTSATLTLESVDAPGSSYAANVNLSGNAVMTLQHGASAFITTLTGSASLNIRSGGSASTTTLSSGGTFNLFGSARYNSVCKGGYMFVNSGGQAYGNYVSYGGLLRIYDSGFASSSFVSSGGVMDVFSGGSASGTIIYGGGSMYVGNKARVTQTVLSGGSLTLYGRSDDGVYSAGLVTVSSGGSSYGESFYCSTVVESSGDSSGTIERATIGSGITVLVSGGRLEGKTVSNATIWMSGGYVGLSGVEGLRATVLQGTFWASSGNMSSAYVGTGGKLYMMQGATAAKISVSSGGHCGVGSDCIVSSADVGTSVGSTRGTMGISSGGRLISARIAVGTIDVGLGGSAANLLLTYGGSAIVKGSVSSALVSSGSVTVSSGGTVASATLRKGALNILGTVSSARTESGTQLVLSSGGIVRSGAVFGSATISQNATAYGLLIVSGGSMNVLGQAVNMHALDATIDVRSGGRLSSGTVSSGGTLTLNNNAVAFSCTVGSGGVMKISSGATIGYFNVRSGGKITGYYNGANIAFSSGAIADFNIFNLSPGNTSTPVSGLSDAMNKGVVFTITVSASQSKGTYKIASHASGFKETISVQNMYGDALGTLTVGQTVSIGGVGYKLEVNSSNVLSVTVGAAAPVGSAKSDINANGISDVMFQYTGGNYQLGFWLDGSNTWKGNGLQHPAEWDVLGAYDMNSNGKADAVLFGNVTSEAGIHGAYIGYYADSDDKDANWVNIGYLTNEDNIDWKNKVGNLTGNSGKNSIVWYTYELGALGVWTDGTESWVSMGSGFDATWTLIGCGDFNGDGRDQVVMSHNSGEEYHAIDIGGTWTNLGASDSGWEVRAIGDFAGDGRDDIVAFHGETGIVAMWGDGNVANWSKLGQLDKKDWFVVGAGDYNGDAKDDLLVRQISTGMLGYYASGSMSNWNTLGYGVDMSWTVIA